eukprot:Hpha_TRINITY_DN10305_c0_g3::TRINITY_DN10305_c0_g3_i1::g.116072::m.116072
MRCISSCTDWFVRPGDRASDIRVKRTGFPVLVLVLFIVCVLTARSIRRGTTIMLVGALLFIVTGLALLAWGKAGMHMGKALDVALPLFALGSIIFDMHAVTQGDIRLWTIVVLVLDAALVYGRPRVL